MYTITIIRLDPETKVFQNTEVSTFMLQTDVENELRDMGCDHNQIDLVGNMSKMERVTFESCIYAGVKRGLRFAYVYRF